jgi:hypothetical protein
MLEVVVDGGVIFRTPRCGCAGGVHAGPLTSWSWSWGGTNLWCVGGRIHIVYSYESVWEWEWDFEAGVLGMGAMMEG